MFFKTLNRRWMVRKPFLHQTIAVGWKKIRFCGKSPTLDGGKTVFGANHHRWMEEKRFLEQIISVEG